MSAVITILRIAVAAFASAGLALSVAAGCFAVRRWRQSRRADDRRRHDERLRRRTERRMENERFYGAAWPTR